jgi:hypothetical protein
MFRSLGAVTLKRNNNEIDRSSGSPCASSTSDSDSEELGSSGGGGSSSTSTNPLGSSELLSDFLANTMNSNNNSSNGSSSPVKAPRRDRTPSSSSLTPTTPSLASPPSATLSPVPSGEISGTFSQLSNLSKLRKIPSRQLAMQMTALDAATYAEIQPEEMLTQNWTKKNKEVVAPTLTRLSAIFNEWSYWVSTEIITAGSIAEQVTTTKRFINLLDHLFKLNNFQSLMAVLSGLNRVSVSRLTRMWDQVPSRYVELMGYMDEVMSPLNNFKYYRALLAELREKKPIIPYLVVFLRDLTFINDGNEERLPVVQRKGNVKYLPNFEKMTLLGQQILELEAYRSVPYNLKREDDICELLSHVPYLDEDTLHEKSLAQQPPQSSLSGLEPERKGPTTPAVPSDDNVELKNPILALQELTQKIEQLHPADDTDSEDSLTS